MISVVVPTRDRPAALARCLEAIARQESSVRFETIVVDDGSTDAEAIRSAAADRAAVVRQRATGPAAARNAGVDAAAGAIVCFVDDDCVPAPDWLERLHGAARAGAVAVAGRTVNGRAGDVLAEASQLIANSLMAAPGAPRSQLRFAPTSNLCCTRELLLAVRFDPAFAKAAGEDRDWCARVLALGNVLTYEPAAVVAHWPTLSLTAFWRQHVRYGRGAHAYRRRRPGGLEPRRFYADLLREGFRKGVRVGLLVVLAQLATACGYAAAWRGQRELGSLR